MNKFTADNILSCDIEEHEDGNVTIRIEVGNTDSDCGTVILDLSNADYDHDGVPAYDVDVQTENGANWGLWAIANAVSVAVQYFYDAGLDKRYSPVDNTGITGL